MGSVLTHYKYMHRFPELSGQEFKTSHYIEGALKAAGYTPMRLGSTSVVADLVTSPDLPWLLFRADMDALPIVEKNISDFPSEISGVMHACGHDAHSAMLLTAAEKLRPQSMPQNIRFVFQSAEETTQGASELVQLGGIPRNLLACFAMHVWPGVTEGTIATKPGSIMASSDVFRVNVKGSSAHCAQSHKGADALQTTVEIVSGLPDIQRLAQEETILFCGSIHTGSSHNIVPDEASIWGTIRTYSEADRHKMKQLLESAVEGAANHYGTVPQIQWEGGCPVVCNNRKLVEKLCKVFPALNTNAEPTMAAEDFAFYQQYAPGVMLWLGTGDTPPLHNEAFYIPEQILDKGVAAWIQIGSHDWKEA